jgi:four helix bundle protein
MTPDELRERLLTFATDVATFAKPLFNEPSAKSAANQLIRSSASAAANHRAAGEARSPDEFISKLSQALEESDETWHWFLWLKRMRFGDAARLDVLLQEAVELTKILGASKRTARRNEERRRQERKAAAKRPRSPRDHKSGEYEPGESS